MSAEHPIVTVRDTGTYRMALVTVVLERVPHAEGEEREITHVEAAAQHVHAEEMTVETFARPPLEFGLYEPMFPFAVVRECEGIESRRDFEGRTLTQSDLHAQIGRGRRQIEKIGL